MLSIHVIIELKAASMGWWGIQLTLKNSLITELAGFRSFDEHEVS